MKPSALGILVGGLVLAFNSSNILFTTTGVIISLVGGILVYIAFINRG